MASFSKIVRFSWDSEAIPPSPSPDSPSPSSPPWHIAVSSTEDVSTNVTHRQQHRRPAAHAAAAPAFPPVSLPVQRAPAAPSWAPQPSPYDARFHARNPPDPRVRYIPHVAFDAVDFSRSSIDVTRPPWTERLADTTHPISLYIRARSEGGPHLSVLLSSNGAQAVTAGRVATVAHDVLRTEARLTDDEHRAMQRRMHLPIVMNIDLFGDEVLFAGFSIVARGVVLWLASRGQLRALAL
ncbi:hypothetical protein BD626DRAFT_637573 [Schizophyllum amplum]|uniref:Uncharacterized protein n=1 Tax=Schizophyllum amplum TaxID=97359 RepID=A0A550BS94_9AGAR|nr:hypothetical protein BD626DRAFT_637573 [Auriculariopsis ampla]